MVQSAEFVVSFSAIFFMPRYVLRSAPIFFFHAYGAACRFSSPCCAFSHASLAAAACRQPGRCRHFSWRQAAFIF
jgi:hypothetical protein